MHNLLKIVLTMFAAIQDQSPLFATFLTRSPQFSRTLPLKNYIFARWHKALGSVRGLRFQWPLKVPRVVRKEGLKLDQWVLAVLRARAQSFLGFLARKIGRSMTPPPRPLQLRCSFLHSLVMHSDDKNVKPGRDRNPDFQRWQCW